MSSSPHFGEYLFWGIKELLEAEVNETGGPAGGGGKLPELVQEMEACLAVLQDPTHHSSVFSWVGDY